MSEVHGKFLTLPSAQNSHINNTFLQKKMLQNVAFPSFLDISHDTLVENFQILTVITTYNLLSETRVMF